MYKVAGVCVRIYNVTELRAKVRKWPPTEGRGGRGSGLTTDMKKTQRVGGGFLYPCQMPSFLFSSAYVQGRTAGMPSGHQTTQAPRRNAGDLVSAPWSWCARGMRDEPSGRCQCVQHRCADEPLRSCRHARDLGCGVLFRTAGRRLLCGLGRRQITTGCRPAADACSQSSLVLMGCGRRVRTGFLVRVRKGG